MSIIESIKRGGSAVAADEESPKISRSSGFDLKN